MAIPKVYKSSDPGAPVLNGATVDSAIVVLRKCLVDGYGSIGPAGWTEEFTGTNKAVFRNAVAGGGTGCCLRVEAFNSYRGPFSLASYSSMSDVDTGDNSTGASFGWRNLSGGAETQSWIVVATEHAFHFCAGGASASMLCGAGDLVTQSLGDAYRYFVYGWRNTSNWNYPPSFLSQSSSGDSGFMGGWGSVSADSGLRIGKNHTGIGSSVGAGVLQPRFYSGEPYIGGSGYPALPSANSADAACMAAHVIHGSAGAAVIRGRLPGMYIPLFNIGGKNIGDIDVATAGGMSSTVVLTAAQISGSAGVLVETALDWG